MTSEAQYLYLIWIINPNMNEAATKNKKQLKHQRMISTRKFLTNSFHPGIQSNNIYQQYLLTWLELRSI